MELNDFLEQLSEPARRAIEQLQCITLDDILRYSDKELLSLHGVGPKTIRILNAFLQENGINRQPE